MQRCLLLRLPLPRARLQAAASPIQKSWHLDRPIARGVLQQRAASSTQQETIQDDALSSLEDSINARGKKIRDHPTEQAVDAWSWTSAYESLQDQPSLAVVRPEVDEAELEERGPRIRRAVQNRPQAISNELAEDNVSARPDNGAFSSQEQYDRLKGDLEDIFHNRFEAEASPVTEEDQAQDWVRGFMDPEVVTQRWKQSFLWLLKHESHQSLEFLNRTRSLLRIPGICIHWAFRIAIDDIAKRVEPELAGALYDRVLQDAAMLTRYKTFGHTASLPVETLRTLLDNLQDDQIRLLLSLMESKYLNFAFVDYARLAARLATFDLDKALDCLEAGFLSKAMRFQPDLPLSRLVMILARQAIEQPDGYTRIYRFCDIIVQHKGGFDPRIGSLLVAALVERGQNATAAKTYDRVFHLKAMPSTYVLECLISAYNDGLSTAVSLDELIRVSFEGGAAQRSPYITSRLLKFESKRVMELDDIRLAWPTLCALFNSMFDSDVLEKLGLPNDIEEQRACKLYPEIERRQPHSRDIVTMLVTFCKLSYDGQLPEIDPVDVYNAWRSLAMRGDLELYSKTLETDNVYNAFLLLFAKQEHTLINATDVMRDMQEPLPESAGRVNCKPTTVSWNCFLLAFRRHKRTDLADQVLAHMRNIGIEPNEVTWTILMSQAVHTQKLERVVDVLNRMENNGGVVNEYIQKYVRDDFRNQRGLRSALRKQVDFSEDLKDGIAARLDQPDSTPGRHGTPEG